MQVDLAQNGNEQRPGVTSPARGKVYKGFNHSALNKVSLASIPTKYEIVILPRQNTKAFGTSADRFVAYVPGTSELTPGPGRYNPKPIATEDPNAATKLHSPKGYIAQSRRFLDSLAYTSQNNGPGPGSYDHDPLLQTRRLSAKKNKNSYMFVSVKKKQNNLRRAESPGPGYYLHATDSNGQPVKTAGSHAESQNRMAMASAVFKSSSLREMQVRSVSPPPGTYDVTVKPLKNDHHTGYTSAFMSPKNTRRRKSRDIISELLNESFNSQQDEKRTNVSVLLPRDDSNTSYRHITTITDTVEAATRYRISERLRLRKRAELDAMPGPGAYEQTAQFGKDPSKVKSSSFLSGTKRNPYGFRDDDTTQPTNGIRSPYLKQGLPLLQKPLKKADFHYNSKKIWV
jgi:hypothetical protein